MAADNQVKVVRMGGIELAVRMMNVHIENLNVCNYLYLALLFLTIDGKKKALMKSNE